MAGFGFSFDSLKSKLQEAGEKVRVWALSCLRFCVRVPPGSLAHPRRQVKARVSEIDTEKVKETLAKARESAGETFSQVRLVGEAHLQETTQTARQLADRQAKQLAKVNAKSLLNSNANFGVPIEALAYRDQSGAPSDTASVPVALEMMVAYLESSEPVTSGMCAPLSSERTRPGAFGSWCRRAIRAHAMHWAGRIVAPPGAALTVLLGKICRRTSLAAIFRLGDLDTRGHGSCKGDGHQHHVGGPFAAKRPCGGGCPPPAVGGRPARTAPVVRLVSGLYRCVPFGGQGWRSTTGKGIRIQ